MVGIEFLFLDAFYLLGAYNHLAHDLRHERLGLVGGLLYLFVAHFDRRIKAAQVGDDRHAEDADAAVVGNNHLWYGGHADGIAAYDAVHLIFCGCLEGGALYADIDTVFDAYLFLLGYLRSEFDEGLVVGLVHIGESRTGGEILATEGMLGEEVDVVGDDHQVAHAEILIHAAGGIADEEGLDAQFVHHADGEGHFLHRVALVEMEAPLHGEDIDATQFAEDEFAFVTFDRRDGKVGYLRVWNLLLVSYL